MARAPRVVGVPDDVYDQQKTEKAKRCQKFEVIGAMGIRDAISRETVKRPGVVNLDPTETHIPSLISIGFIKPAEAEAGKES